MVKACALIQIVRLKSLRLCVSARGKKTYRSGELRVGTSGNQPPFSMKSKDGQLMGYEIDLALMLRKR